MNSNIPYFQCDNNSECLSTKIHFVHKYFSVHKDEKNILSYRTFEQRECIPPITHGIHMSIIIILYYVIKSLDLETQQEMHDIWGTPCGLPSELQLLWKKKLSVLYYK